jgi:RNA polymerase sigma-70 factor, ECF subfamily
VIPPEARQAWPEIEARLRPYVARRVPAADVADVVQEILVRVHRGLETLQDGQRFGGWVYRIAERVIADAARGRARLPVPVGEAVGAAAAPEREPELESELAECVALFVARLPSPYREAVTLTELRGLTQKDAANLLGVSLSGVKSRVQRGRRKIRQMFEACCQISLDCRGRVTDYEPRLPSSGTADCEFVERSCPSRRGAG